MNNKPHLLRGENFRFLIVGAGRGGTSLLAGLLDYHPHIVVGFEHGTRKYLRGKEIQHNAPDIFHQRVTAFLEACIKEASRFPGFIWGNKITTEQVYSLEKTGQYISNDVFDRFFNHYLKNKKIIFILRDGRNCIHSKVQRTGNSFTKAAHLWHYSVECYRFLKSHNNNNFCIRFEDLINVPEKVLRDICTFLGVPFTEEMLKGTKNPKMRTEYLHETFDRSKTKHIDLPEEILEIIQEDLKYCDYL